MGIDRVRECEVQFFSVLFNCHLRPPDQISLIILIDSGIAPKEVPLTPGSEAVCIVAHESE